MAPGSPGETSHLRLAGGQRDQRSAGKDAPRMKTDSPPSSSSLPGQRWFALALVLFFLFLSIPYGVKAWHNGSAFQRWQPQISDLGNGVDIAERYNYPNPPIMALLL